MRICRRSGTWPSKRPAPSSKPTGTEPAIMNGSPLLIWGAGAIGGTVGAYWRRAGHEVLFVDRDADHVAAINRDGLKITGPIEEFAVKAPAALAKDLPKD